MPRSLYPLAPPSSNQQCLARPLTHKKPPHALLGNERYRYTFLPSHCPTVQPSCRPAAYLSNCTRRSGGRSPPCRQFFRPTKNSPGPHYSPVYAARTAPHQAVLPVQSPPANSALPSVCRRHTARQIPLYRRTARLPAPYTAVSTIHGPAFYMNVSHQHNNTRQLSF